MDILQLKSKLMRKIVGTIIRKAIKKKLNCDAYVDLKDLDVSVNDDKAKIDISGTIEINSSDLMNLVKEL